MDRVGDRIDVFISYKREDEQRVARLVRALERQGLSVWWDLALPVGERWREGIETALNEARCVVVVWTRVSVTPQAGQFVHDEAGRAMARRVLVQILLDKVTPPLGFGQEQALDMTRWRGSHRDPYLRDLVAAVRARIDGRPAPKPLAAVQRLRRRLTWGGAASALVMLGGAFATNALNLQQQTCAAPVLQPWLSDACGAWGLGGRPKQAERLAWDARPAGNCEALREHLRRFPDGAYRATADAMLGARAVTRVSHSVPEQRSLTLYVGQDAAPSADESAARAAALQRGQTKAEQRCRDFANTSLFQFRSAEVQPQEWVCDRSGGGRVCGFEGLAVCALEGASVVEQERCDAAVPMLR